MSNVTTKERNVMIGKLDTMSDGELEQVIREQFKSMGIGGKGSQGMVKRAIALVRSHSDRLPELMSILS